MVIVQFKLNNWNLEKDPGIIMTLCSIQFFLHDLKATIEELNFLNNETNFHVT